MSKKQNNKDLVLSEDEKLELATYGRVVIKRNGFELLIIKTVGWDNLNYEIYAYSPYNSESIDKQMEDYYNKIKNERKGKE